MKRDSVTFFPLDDATIATISKAFLKNKFEGSWLGDFNDMIELNNYMNQCTTLKNNSIYFGNVNNNLHAVCYEFISYRSLVTFCNLMTYFGKKLIFVNNLGHSMILKVVPDACTFSFYKKVNIHAFDKEVIKNVLNKIKEPKYKPKKIEVPEKEPEQKN